MSLSFNWLTGWSGFKGEIEEMFDHLMGLLALTLLKYRTAFAEPITREYMRQVDEPIVALGPALQFARGLLFAIAFYPLRENLFGRKNGWLTMWSLLVMLGILSTFAAAPRLGGRLALHQNASQSANLRLDGSDDTGSLVLNHPVLLGQPP